MIIPDSSSGSYTVHLWDYKTYRLSWIDQDFQSFALGDITGNGSNATVKEPKVCMLTHKCKLQTVYQSESNQMNK